MKHSQPTLGMWYSQTPAMRAAIWSVLPPVLPHVTLLLDASPPMLPAGFGLLCFDRFYLM